MANSLSFNFAGYVNSLQVQCIIPLFDPVAESTQQGVRFQHVTEGVPNRDLLQHLDTALQNNRNFHMALQTEPQMEPHIEIAPLRTIPENLSREAQSQGLAQRAHDVSHSHLYPSSTSNTVLAIREPTIEGNKWHHVDAATLKVASEKTDWNEKIAKLKMTITRFEQTQEVQEEQDTLVAALLDLAFSCVEAQRFRTAGEKYREILTFMPHLSLSPLQKTRLEERLKNLRGRIIESTTDTWDEGVRLLSLRGKKSHNQGINILIEWVCLYIKNGDLQTAEAKFNILNELMEKKLESVGPRKRNEVIQLGSTIYKLQHRI